MALKSIKETIRNAALGLSPIVVERLAIALERREADLLKSLSASIAVAYQEAVKELAPSTPEPSSTKTSPEKQALTRDQSEGRKLPDYLVMAGDNPRGHPGRTLYAVWHRTLNHRVSVWFESAASANTAVDFYNGDLRSAWLPQGGAREAEVTGTYVMSDERARELFA